jgi:hypothetical protein
MSYAVADWDKADLRSSELAALRLLTCPSAFHRAEENV